MLEKATDCQKLLKEVGAVSFFLLIFLASAQNVIVTENAQPGNPSSEWDIDGAGDLSIQGFATDISVNKGETVRFKIKTDANAYTIKYLPALVLPRVMEGGLWVMALLAPHCPKFDQLICMKSALVEQTVVIGLSLHTGMCLLMLFQGFISLN